MARDPVGRRCRVLGPGISRQTSPPVAFPVFKLVRVSILQANEETHLSCHAQPSLFTGHEKGRHVEDISGPSLALFYQFLPTT